MFDSESDLSGDLSDDELVEVPLVALRRPLLFVIWIALCLNASDGRVFGRFDLAGLCGSRTLNGCYVVLGLNLAGAAAWHSGTV